MIQINMKRIVTKSEHKYSLTKTVSYNTQDLNQLWIIFQSLSPIINWVIGESCLTKGLCSSPQTKAH